MWPSYSLKCRNAVEVLLRKGGSLSAYRANPLFPSWTGPQEGSYAYKLEREVEKKFKVRHAIAVNSGTAALHAALVGAGITSGEVVVPPFTFSATVSAVLLAGATPVFCDVDPYSFTISKETVKRVITKRTRAILPVHLFGGMADVRGIQSLGLPVIEDACQAVGARSGDGYSGTLGLAGGYSFNGTKAVPAGEAGCLVTNSDNVAEAARLLSNHGENFGSSIGLNYRPNELTACVAYHGLLEVKKRNEIRRELAYSFYAHLCHYGVANQFSPAHWGRTTWDTHVFYVAPLTYHGKSRNKFIKACQKRGLAISGGYITPSLEKYDAFRKYCKTPLPNVTRLSENTLCIVSSLTPDQKPSHAKWLAREIAGVIREDL